MSFGPQTPNAYPKQEPEKKESFKESAISKSKIQKNSLDFRISMRNAADLDDDSVEIERTALQGSEYLSTFGNRPSTKVYRADDNPYTNDLDQEQRS